MTGPFIAVDWGTTHRRISRIEDGQAVVSEQDEHGAASIATNEYAGEVAAIRASFGDLPMLLAGMVGSDVGWRKVAYVEAPATLADLAGALEWLDERTAIVPGVCCRAGNRVDVMRGEEVQFLGAAEASLVPADALLCQPGTHCKWAVLNARSITSFTTTMTGELFALLQNRGLLARQLTGPIAVGPAFFSGVAEGARRDLAASLFSIRARGLLGLLDDSDAASFASGVVVGADTAARIDAGEEWHILADPVLGELYAAAIDALGGVSRRVESHTAFVAGISGLWDLAS